jgi:hypothetical protein
MADWIIREFGGSVVVRGTTAAISIAEGDTYVEPPYLQIFYRHQTRAQALRASQHNFTSFTLSPTVNALPTMSSTPGAGSSWSARSPRKRRLVPASR